MHYVLVRKLLYSALLTILFIGRVNAGQWPIEIFEVMDDKKIVIFVDDGDIASSPEWRPAEGGPPLTINGVLKHLNRWMAQYERLAGMRVLEIELKPIHGHEQEHRWYYVVKLGSSNGGEKRARYAVVLFNGKVVSGVVEPASVK